MPLYWHASRILHDQSFDNLMKKVYSQTIYRYFSQRSYLHYWSFQKEYIMLSDDTNLGLIFCKNHNQRNNLLQVWINSFIRVLQCSSFENQPVVVVLPHIKASPKERLMFIGTFLTWGRHHILNFFFFLSQLWVKIVCLLEWVIWLKLR